MARRTRPQGLPTRGKTAPNRLRRLDTWLLACRRELFAHRAEPGLFVDLGFGRVPGTTLETAARLRTLDPHLEVLGVELDPDRVEAARPFEDPLTRFKRGGFEVDPGRPVRLLRAMNVLRQYPPGEEEAAWRNLGRRLEEGGLLIEGTSSPFGRLVAVHLWERRSDQLHHRGLLMAMKVLPEVAPSELQTVLPKDLMDRVVPGEPVHTFFSDWMRCWAESQPWRPFGARAVYRESIRRLAKRQPLDGNPWLARHGYVRWCSPRASLGLSLHGTQP